MAIDPKLVSIKTAGELPVSDPSDNANFLFYEGEALQRSPMSNMYDKVSSGLLPATTTTVPEATGFHRYLVNEAGTYTNFSGIVVSAADLDIVNGVANNEVILEVNNGVATKRVRRVKGDAGAVNYNTGALSPTSTDKAETGKTVSEFIKPITRNLGNFFKEEYIGFRLSENGSPVTTPNENILTDYIAINADSITVKGRSTSIIPLVCFYDINKLHISFIRGQEFDGIEKTILKSEFPTNAAYARFNGKNLAESYVYIDTLQDVVEKVGALSVQVENLNYTKDLSSNLTLNGYWRFDAPNNRRFYPVAGYKSLQIVRVTVGDEFICTSSVNVFSTSVIFHPLFDENDNIIGIFTKVAGRFIITKEMYDAGVRKVSFSYRIDDVLSLKLIRKFNSELTNDQIESLLDVVKSIDSKPLGAITGAVAMGASLMSPENSWFKRGTDLLKIKGYNKAIAATQPNLFANLLYGNQFLNAQEFEDADVLVMQFANNNDVDDVTDLKPMHSDYTVGFPEYNASSNPFNIYTSAQQIDYILKYWQQWCYAQKDNPASKWYGSVAGKPCLFIFCTHWHDARDNYNKTIRLLATRWGAIVCEFDKNIGFSKNQVLNTNGTQVSILYARDTQVSSGLTVGWHPFRELEGGGAGLEIQKKMSNIFADALRKFALK